MGKYELVPIQAKKTYGGEELWSQSFVTRHELEVQRV